MQRKQRKCPGRQGRRGLIFLTGLILAGILLTLRGRANAERLQFPLDTDRWRISDGYGWRADPFTGEQTFHRGIDLACAEGIAALAADDGIVEETVSSDSYGNCIRLLHTGNRKTLYAHLQYVYVRPGETVQRGQLLGTAGCTGRATGAHLHFELWRQGIACDPAAALGLDT